MFVFFFCSHWSLVDVPLIFFCPADHVPDWQPRILLGMVEARSVNVKKTTTLPLPWNADLVLVGELRYLLLSMSLHIRMWYAAGAIQHTVAFRFFCKHNIVPFESIEVALDMEYCKEV